MEQILQVVTLLRETHQFHGYIHIKAIPGTDPSLIDRIGWYVDRMSINMELPTANSLHQLAPHKSRSNILTPMRTIQQLRDHNRDYYGERLIASSESIHKLPSPLYNEVKEDKVFYKPTTMKVGQKRFVPAGQSTQFIIGASEDTDYEIIKTTEALYNKFDLKRVFYSAFMNINKDSTLPDTTSGPPLLREHRLYQADWLLRFYQFKADEIISSNSPNLNTLLDPKCNYALNHMELFPIEITTASYHRSEERRVGKEC